MNTILKAVLDSLTIQELEEARAYVNMMLGYDEAEPDDTIPKWKAQVVEHITKREKLAAVKLWKDSTGIGLKEAKDEVDALCTKLGY